MTVPGASGFIDKLPGLATVPGNERYGTLVALTIKNKKPGCMAWTPSRLPLLPALPTVHLIHPMVTLISTGLPVVTIDGNELAQRAGSDANGRIGACGNCLKDMRRFIV